MTDRGAERGSDWKNVVTLVAALMAAAVSVYNAALARGHDAWLEQLSDTIERDRVTDEFLRERAIVHLDEMLLAWGEIRSITDVAHDRTWIAWAAANPSTVRGQFQHAVTRLAAQITALRAFRLSPVDAARLKGGMQSLRGDWENLAGLLLAGEEARGAEMARTRNCPRPDLPDVADAYEVRHCLLLDVTNALDSAIVGFHQSAIDSLTVRMRGAPPPERNGRGTRSGDAMEDG